MLSNTYKIHSVDSNESSFFRQDFAEFNETKIALNTVRNFHSVEYNSLYTKSFRYEWLDYDIEYFMKLDKLDHTELRYARLLAFYRRIDIDFYGSISDPITINSFPIDTIDNFKISEELFEKYYCEFEAYNQSEKLKETFKRQYTLWNLRLWLAGYGVMPGFTKKHITDQLLSEMVSFTRTRSRVGTLIKYLRFISFVLTQEDNSPVSGVVKIRETTTIFDSEVSKWDKAIKDDSFGKILKDFVVNYIYPRTENPILHEYRNSNGELIRETYGQLSPGAFRNYSGGLRDMYLELKKINITSTEGALNSGISTVLGNKIDNFGRTKYSTMKTATRLWVRHYISDNNLNLNLYKIVPPSRKRRITNYGKILNTSDAAELIDILLDDQSPFYEKMSITDYRCRYMTLLMLSTGQRVSEISCLAYDCLKKNKNGELYLIIHKTKRKQGNTVLATPDIIEYVDKLRKYSPKLKIFFSSEIYPYADNLTIKRLVANKYNDGPLTEETVNNFLKRIQRYLWGEDFSKKNDLFACHDFRRIKATYMNWLGYQGESIQNQLGQNNINSQLSYLQTKSAEHQEAFSNIYNQGVYKVDENGDVLINKNRIFNKAKELSLDNDKESHEELVKVILSNIKNAENITIKSVDTTVLEPTGFPVGIYSCSASQLMNCSKSPINCFGCDYYVPDEYSLDKHKVEILRYIILSQYQSKSINSTKNIMIKDVVSKKIKSIDLCIDNSFKKLFGKFNLNDKEVSKIKDDLQKKAKSYLRKYGKLKPAPTFKDAKKYLKDGEI